MNTFQAFAKGQANRSKPLMVFDWAKAARLIKKHKPQTASAGLCGDWVYTGGEIYKYGEIVTDSYTYLASTWAEPELEMDGEVYDCYIMGNKTKWDAHTKWPEEAIRILNGRSDK